MAVVAAPPVEDGWLESLRDGDQMVIRLGGALTTRHVAPVDDTLRGLDLSAARRLEINLKGLSGFDTAGAWLVHRTRELVRKGGGSVTLTGASAAQLALIEAVADNVQPCPPAPAPGSSVVRLVAHVGRATLELGAEARELVSFLGQTVLALGRAMLRPGRVRATPLVYHMEEVGLNAVPIVGLLSFLIGIVLAYQGADQLARFGAEIFAVNLVGVGVLREMGVLLTAIIVAGRTGSAFAAQIGTMKVNEEVDAMRTIGLDPMEMLVLPRVLALLLTLPLLGFFADIMGLLGGAVMASWVLDISLLQYVRQLQSAVSVSSFWVGLIKAPVFAFVIGLVGCFEGLKVDGSAESVGRKTTQAVVESIFLVIVLDAVFSILFSIIGW